MKNALISVVLVLSIFMMYGTMPRVHPTVVVATETEVQMEEEPVVEVIPNTSAKTYMDYRKITNETSAQWRLIHESGYIIVCEDGFLRDWDDRYGVALGSSFGAIGTKVDFTLEGGKLLRCIKIEEKADHDTIDGFRHNKDGSVIEFVLDTKRMAHLKGTNGLICNGNLNQLTEFQGNIEKWQIADDSSGN